MDRATEKPGRDDLPGAYTPQTLPAFIPVWLRDKLDDLRGAPLSVFVAYASRANKGGIAWPSLGCLAKDTGYGIRSCKAARKKLIKMKLLIPERQEREKGGKFGRRLFRLPWASQCPP